MTHEIPQFLPTLDLEKHNNHMSDFDVEMFQCTNSGRVRARHVNILHCSTELEHVFYEMDRIVQFMKDEGYDVKRQPPKLWRDADILIVGSGTAHLVDVNYIIYTSLRLGLMPNWDVLHYGIDYNPESVMPFQNQVLYSNNVFSTRAIGLVSAHIMRRDDVITLSGLHISMLTAIELDIDTMLQSWKMRFTDKIKLFRQKIKNDGNWGPDAEMFFAAVSIIQTGRKIAAHPIGPVDLNEKIKSWSVQMANFCNLAEKYNHSIDPPLSNSETEAKLHQFIKWENSIARAAITWVSSYKDRTID